MGVKDKAADMQRDALLLLLHVRRSIDEVRDAQDCYWPRHWRNIQRILSRITAELSLMMGTTDMIFGWIRDLTEEGVESQPGPTISSHNCRDRSGMSPLACASF